MDDATTAEEAKRYVPSGVDPQSWIGFEQRVQERRYRALVQHVEEAIARGDAISARVTLEEARELCPGAEELTALSERISTAPLSAPPPPRFAWSRAMSAVSMLVAGVALLVTIEWIHPPRPLPASRPLASAVTAAPMVSVPASEPVSAPTVARAADAGDAPAISSEPDVSLPEPVATSGAEPAVNVARPAVGGPVTAPFRPETFVDSGVPASAREVPDDDAAADARSARESNAGDIEKASRESADTSTSEPSRVDAGTPLSTDPER